MHVSKEQILVVDDEEELRASIVEILTLDGFEVEQANSAVAAPRIQTRRSRAARGFGAGASGTGRVAANFWRTGRSRKTGA